MADRPSSAYPPDEWRIIEAEFHKDMLPRNESIFTVGNGYIGLRGNLEERTGSYQDGTYLNGFYDSNPIVYAEIAPGYARNSQTMLNVTDGKEIKLWVDNEPFDLWAGTILDYRRVLDMRKGVLTREVVWQSPAGRKMAVRSTRLVSFSHRHLALISYSVESLDGEASLVLKSSLDGNVRNQPSGKDPRVGSALKGQILKPQDRHAEGSFAALKHVTRNTHFILSSAAEHCLDAHCPFTMDTEQEPNRISVVYRVQLKEKEEVRLFKYIAYYTSRDHDPDELMPLARQEVSAAKEKGFEYFLSDQRRFLRSFWKKSDIRIEGDPAVQQSLHFNLFHLLQSAGRDGRTGVAAKGLTGEGYEGHYFWDTEIYVLPFFIYTNPEIARKLVEFRGSILDKARQRASEVSQKGALFPWRTINGEECSAYYPAGTAQYHINADIVYAMRKYIEVSGDLDFLRQAGAETLFETARFWVDFGDYIPKKEGRFCLNCVTGPDEYTAVVNNNTYTNLMAMDHLEYAVKTAGMLKQKYPNDFAEVSERISLKEEEILAWEKAASGIYPQDDSFFDKAVWSFEKTPERCYPLLLHYHPLVIYRHQVLKQPDLVLALFLQGNRFTAAEKKRNFDYYDPLTTGDSSLSPCVQSVVAAEIGYTELAYRYFMQTARIDLEDSNNNVRYGVHTAAMGGAWISLVYGFAGMRDFGGCLSFRPRLPASWTRLCFKLIVQGNTINIDIRKDSVIYTLISGPGISITHEKSTIHLSPGTPVTVSLKSRIEAVIFDLDGVITDTAECHYKSWKRLADELDIPFTRGDNESLKGVSRMESLDIILNKGGRSCSQEEKEALAERKNEYYRRLIAGITPEDLLPGIKSLLEELKGAGIKLALASVSRNAQTVIDNLQVGEYFDLIVDPAAIRMGKPDPEIFLQAADRLNIPYRNCVGVEDAQAGVAAIKAAGMFAVGIGSSLNGADWKAADTSQLSWSELNRRFLLIG